MQKKSGIITAYIIQAKQKENNQTKIILYAFIMKQI